MPDILLSQPMYMLVSLVLSVVVTGAMIGGTVLFEQQRSRLDPATRWHDIRERLAIKREELARKEAEITEAIRKLSERDRAVAETAALEERRDAVRLELAALDDAKHQIEQTKQAAADAATDLAVRQDHLAAVQKELETAERGLADCKAELARIAEEIESEKRKFGEIPVDLKRTIDELRASLGELKVEKITLEEELLSLRNERGLLTAQRAEHAELAARKEALARHVEDLTAETKKKLDKVDAVSREVSATTIELAHLQQTMSGANQELHSVREEVQALLARREILEGEVKKHHRPDADDSGQPEEMIADLKKLPTLLENITFNSRGLQSETDALEDVHHYLRDLKLSYDRRTVTAFHTALKINDISQLTVLAGVSGTGKSLLPRRYAEAMGIHFLPIAVEPRWDSPQDLLGFYNYIEKRYRATDLARSLVHMDPYNTSTLAGSAFRDQMMLVLLDEMNLARVEYYFSEFLSRLETRPPHAASDDERRRRDSWISIDIRGIKKGSINLYPPHNMLFAGTMNDDESTQSLSDKVLDRSNIMQFAAPEEFTKQQQVTNVSPKEGYRSFGQWRRWIKTTDQLKGAADDKARGVIKELAAIMERCGRPFGHRLNASMLAYAANYPKQSNLEEGLEMAMADQIEFRILPKLRGLRIEDHSQVFELIEKLVENDLNDSRFAERIRSTAEQQREAGGLFNWRGYARNTDGPAA